MGASYHKVQDKILGGVMLSVGDLVTFKRSNIQRDGLNPNKKLGIVLSIKRGAVKSLWGQREDVVIVRWMPWNKTEKVMSFYLELLRDPCENKK